MFWLQLGSSWQAGAWKRQWKYFWTRSVTYLHEAIACSCFFHCKICDRDHAPADCPTIFTSYHFFILLFSPLCFIFERSDTGWLCDHFHPADKPWQAAIGHYDTLCPVKTMLHTLLQMVLISLFFLLFSSSHGFFLSFIWLIWCWMFIFHQDTLRPVSKLLYTLCQITPIDHYYFCYFSNISCFYQFIFISYRLLFDSYFILTQCALVKLLLQNMKSKFRFLRPGRFLMNIRCMF